MVEPGARAGVAEPGQQADPARMLADLLVQARRTGIPLESVPAGLQPADAAHAYRVQALTIEALHGRVGGWKVGASAPAAGPQYAPLPASGVLGPATPAAPLSLRRRDFMRFGLELEIAFRFGTTLEPGCLPRAAQAAQEVVFAHVTEMLLAIEVVDSRWLHWPRVDKLAQLADLQNHGALVIGASAPYDAGFDFTAPAMALTLGGRNAFRDVFRGAGGNPAGDPRWLVAWLACELGRQGQALGAGTVVTAGSYVGVHFVAPQAGDSAAPLEIAGTIDGIGEVRCTLA